MKTRIIFLSMAVCFFCLNSCKKYEDGGWISKADKRLPSGVWKLDKYLRNGSDETSLLWITNFKEEFRESGVMVRTYVDKNGNSSSETGSWSFENDQKQIKISGMGSVDLSNQTSSASSSIYYISRLKKKEFWYYYTNGSDKHEFHFIPE